MSEQIVPDINSYIENVTNHVEIILEKAHEFGENFGIIFQIKDDILDYVGNEKTGKEKGIDIKEIEKKIVDEETEKIIREMRPSRINKGEFSILIKDSTVTTVTID